MNRIFKIKCHQIITSPLYIVIQIINFQTNFIEPIQIKYHFIFSKNRNQIKNFNIKESVCFQQFNISNFDQYTNQ